MVWGGISFITGAGGDVVSDRSVWRTEFSLGLGWVNSSSSRRMEKADGAGEGNWARGGAGAGEAATGRHREGTGGAGRRPVVPEKIMPCNAGVSGGRSAVDLWGRIHGGWPHSRLRYNPRPTALALHPLLSVSCACASPARRSLCCRRYPRSFARYAPDPRPRAS